ncbi:MAG: hypothetical protein DMF50_00610, partial [Acidobacteria bacterium]
HDNTALDGTYGVVVPPRLYNVSFVPPAGTPLETGRISGVLITSNRTGLDAVLRDAFAVSGRVRSYLGPDVAGADLNFYQSGTGIRQIVSRDNTDSTGLYSVLVPPGTYDILYTPPAGSGLALGSLGGVVVQNDVGLTDIVLGPTMSPAISSITPSTGPSDGGTAVSIFGSNFQPGAVVTLGGLDLFNVSIVSPGQINAVTPSCPVGSAGVVVDLAVANVGAASGSGATLPRAFTFTPAGTPVNLTVTRSAPNVILSWPSTGQASYTIYRSASPALFGQAQVLAVTTATTFTDVGADADGVNYFYRVE